jgi:hypothetical protein
MTLISTPFVVTLLVLVSVASLAALVLMAAALGNRLAFHHRARTSRHESIRTYYGHLAPRLLIGH